MVARVHNIAHVNYSKCTYFFPEQTGKPGSDTFYVEVSPYTKD